MNGYLIIHPEGDEPWSTPVQTVWSLPGDGIKYWTTWADPRPEESALKLSEKDTKNMLDGIILTTNKDLPAFDWADPLIPQPMYPRRLMYGASILGNPEIDDHYTSSIYTNTLDDRNFFSVPVVALFNERKDIGIFTGKLRH